MNTYVEVVSYNDPTRVEKRLGPMSENKANRVDTGLNINLDHENYYTRIVNKPEKK